MNDDAFEVVKSQRRADCLKYQEFDDIYGVDTAHETKISGDGKEELVPGTLRNADKYIGSNGYQNTPLSTLTFINEYLSKIINFEEYNFVDVGCGKGRVLLWNNISNINYKKQVGVDVDENLCNIAIDNLSKYGGAEIINIGIENYKIEDEKTVYFIYNPCHINRWKKFLSNNKFGKDTIIVSYIGFEVDIISRVVVEEPELDAGFNKIYEQDLVYFYRNN